MSGKSHRADSCAVVCRANDDVGDGMGCGPKHAENTASAARGVWPVVGRAENRAGGSNQQRQDNDLTSRVIDLIRATQDRSAAYQWPPVARALAEGLTPKLTRKGTRIFYQFRRQYRAQIDLRALDVEVAQDADLFGNDDNSQPRGMTIQQFAEFLVVDRGTLAKSLVEVPTGPAPALTGGKVPTRRIGNVRRIFQQDLLGVPAEQGGHRGNRSQGEAPVSASEPAWAGPLRDLLDP
ncbi:MAG: hypothetical protein GY809_29985 [Planctomycetes bacterium]|nr:hypothetical protein [Planctomycetota bacterium]